MHIIFGLIKYIMGGVEAPSAIGKKFPWEIIFLGIFCLVFLMPLTAHAAYRDTVQAEGTLLNYWPMDEAAGATSVTAVVGGIAINLTGATAGAAGVVDGTAVLFNGTTNFGRTASNLNVTAYNKIVVEALFYTDAYNGTDRALWELSPNTTVTTTGFSFFQDTLTTAKVDLLLKGDIGYNYAYYSRPSAANWHHIVAVYDKGASTNEVNFYVDGVLQTADSRPANSNNTNSFGNAVFYLMSRAGATFFSQGKLQHLAIYGNLSDARILAHAQEALAGVSLSAGTLSEVTHTSSSATVSWTDADGGTAPITAQLQRSLTGAGTWSNVSGATSSPSTDTGLNASTTYDYRVAYTDSIPTTVYSNTVAITTDVTSTIYTIQQADLWDNGYDNVAAPRQSTFAHFVFTTNAATATVIGTTSMFANYPTFSHLGVRINGVDQASLVFTANGSQSFPVALGPVGTTRTVEIIAGAQSKPSGTVIGSFIDSVAYANTASFSVTAPTIQTDRVLVYGDSISVGGNATNPEIEAFARLLRDTYGYSVMLEAWGYRSLYDDTNTSGLRSAFVSRIAGYTPATIWLAIGTNDYGINRWSAANFGTAYAATLDDLHTALPSARIFCQTPIVRSTETANTFGNTLGDYRAQISTVCNARAWTTLIDGSTFLTTANLGDGVHPTTAGHAKFAKRVAPALASPSYTVSGPSIGRTSEASSAFTVTIASASFLGDQTITLTAPSGTIAVTAVGGGISNNGTGVVIVTPTTTATNFTFIYTPAAEGANTVTFTNGQGWSNPAAATYTADSVNPTVALTSVTSPTNLAAFSVTSTFSEDITGFSIGDITVGNGVASNFVTTTANSVYTFDITPTTDGLVMVDVATSSALDAVSNPNDAAPRLSITSDTVAPSTPVIAPNAGSYDSARTIFISSAGSNSIKYTTDGTTPSCTVGTTYTAPFALSSSASVSAVGCDLALNITSVATNTYTISSGGGGGGGGGALTLFNYTDLPSSLSTTAILPLTFTANSLVKLPNDGNAATQQDSAVYYYGKDGRRHAFPNDKVYFTWYSDFSQVQIVSAAELERMPLGQNVTYRPGVRMVKFTTLSRVYAVDAGGLLRWVKTEAIAQALYGSTWNQQIDDISDAFFSNYRFGADINGIADFHPSSVTAAASSIQVDMGF
jgi:lysophospholipase L1-like esterase